jgi:SH3-like domain-containing protein
VAAPAPALPSVLYVGNTDGQGVFLRSQARDGNDTRLTAWTDGTAMTPLETTSVQEASGAATWVRVRDPKGDTGWVRQTYLRPTR